LSGSGIQRVIPKLVGRELSPRHATLTKFLDANGAALDQGVALYFPGPHSYTGEDVLELQGHGGNGILKLVLSRCIEVGARLAEPGEFTRRAFLNGKIDLAQAEAVADLINAQSASAARAAARSLTGALSGAVQQLEKMLLSTRIRVEAHIDFPEEDVDALFAEEIVRGIDAAYVQAGALLDRATAGRRITDGIKIALAGPPNVGKSSLLNYLAGDSVAIVSDIPGTTRDPVSVDVQVAGIPVTFTDTAGIRNTADPIEKIGVERAVRAHELADLTLLIGDATLPGALPELAAGPLLPVWNKCDLLDASASRSREGIFVSALTGEGIAELKDAIIERCSPGSSYDGFSARQRHVAALVKALGHLDCARDIALSGQEVELVAEELRLAVDALRAIRGQATSDELLGHIFSTFCIGK
jgi:tRNA modification GTPase